MCGIAGIFNRGGERVDEGQLKNLRRGIAHRGPDGDSMVVCNGVGLVAARLAMVDPMGSRQPITSRDGRWTLIGNGEIYNYRSLRVLIGDEYDFSTDGDLEVAIPLLARFGPEGLNKIRGPFALILWDALHSRLWLMRDRWGERPLYYTANRNMIAFSSDMASLIDCIGSVPTVDRGLLGSFIGTGLLPSARTLFTTVRKVIPGTVVEIDRNDVRSHRYFHRQFGEGGPLPLSEAAAAFPAILDKAIDRCLRTPWPMTLGFSGGLDSTAILLRARRLSNLRILTLVGDNPARADENRSRAVRIGHYLGVPTEEVPWGIPSPAACFELLSTRQGEPVPDPVALHNDALSRAVSSAGRVVLGGHGADEILAGYGRYRKAAALAPRLTTAHPGAAGMTQLPFAPLFKEWPRMRAVVRWRNLASQVLSGDPECLAGLSELVAEIEHVSSRLTSADPLAIMQLTDFLILDAHENFTLPDESGMAYGVEQRCPYLDHDLVAFAFSCPREALVEHGVGKALLRAYVGQHLPPDLINLPKVGFEQAFGYEDWLIKNREPLLQYVFDGPLPKFRLFRPSLWDFLRRDPEFYREHTGLVWRAFACTAWISTYAPGAA